MGSAASAPEYKGMLAGYLLTSYLNVLAGPKYSVRERIDEMTRLEIEIESFANFAPEMNDQLARALDQMFSWADDPADMIPALDWYLAFLSGRDEAWLATVSAGRLSRLWKSLTDTPLRAKLLKTLLVLDLVNDARYPENSVVRRLFAESEGVQRGAELTGDCKIIAQILLQQAAAAPESTVLERAIRNVRSYSLRVLNLGIKAKVQDDKPLQLAIVTSILSELGDLGNRKPEFESWLSA